MDDWETRVRRYTSETVNGEVVYRRAPASLADYVLGYSGWQVDIPVPVQRRLLPFGGVSVLVDFVPPVRQPPSGFVPPAERARWEYRYPVSGMHDCPIVFRQSGRHFGVGIGLAPAGAYALFGTPLHDITNAVAELADLVGGRADELAERLARARSWPARFELLDDLLPRWLGAGPAQLPAVARAWRRLHQSSGRVTVAQLADDVGRSSRYLELRFRDQVGVSPKTAARVLRFQHAVSIAARVGRPAWSEVATRCGYADQAHLNREFRQLAGCTPTELLAG